MDAVPVICPFALRPSPHPCYSAPSQRDGSAQNPLVTGFWAGGFVNGGPWQKTGGEKKRETKVSLALLLVLDSIVGSDHVMSVASGPDRHPT